MDFVLFSAALAIGLAAAPVAPAPVLTRAPQLVSSVEAEYPPDAAAAGIQGSVTLDLVIDADGGVRQAVVVDPGPHPGFAAAALHAVVQFRFTPAELDGVPAAVEITYRYDFVLRHPEAAGEERSDEPPISLEGIVLEQGSGHPVADATVGVGTHTTTTDTEGRFTLRGLDAGEAQIVVSSPEHELLAVLESVEPGKVKTVEYRIRRRLSDPYEAVVRGDRARREVTVRSLSADEVRTVAGTQGDALRSLQNLPGVARSPFGIGLLVVRGSEPSETPVYVDGIPIPQLYHFGGVSSVVNADVVRSIDLFPGNFSSRYGRALGGTVELTTRDARPAWHGAAQVDLLDGRVEAEGPVAGGTAYAAVRRSWIDGVLSLALPSIDREAASNLRVAPRYWDWQTKLTRNVAGGRGSVFAYGSDDRLEYARPSDAPGRPSFHVGTQFWRAGASHRASLGAVTNDAVVAVGRDQFDLLTGSAFGLLSETLAASARDAVKLRLSSSLAVEAGVDGLFRRIRYGTYAPPVPAPGASVDPFADAPSLLAESASGWWIAQGAWAEADWRAHRRVRVVAGLRADEETRFGRTQAWLDPRVATYLEVRPDTTLTAAAGLFGSTPDPLTTSATFGNPDLAPERALHLSTGVKQRLGAAMQVDVTTYYKRMWSLVVPTRAVGADGRALRYSNEGLGETVGLELLVRREIADGFYGWLSWTLSRSVRRDDPTDPGFPAWHPFLLDQTNVLAAVLSYRLRRGWTLGTRIRGVTGNPITPAAGALLDADTGRYQCVPGAPLSRRLPGFFQADARADKRWQLDGWVVSAYLDVQNVTNRQNAEYQLRSYDCAQEVPLPSVPIFPSLGVRAEW